MTGYWQDLRAGWHASSVLLAMRWRSIRSRSVRLLIFTAIGAFLFGLAGVLNLGEAVQTASQQTDTAAGVYARSWIQFVSAGIMGTLGSAAVGSAVFIALFGPFTGTATVSLVPADDLAGVGPARGHRFFDSLFLNAISGLGLLQLIALTAVTSLLTLDGAHGPGTMVTWLVWATLIAVMTFIGWMLEWTSRRFGSRTRWLLAFVGFAMVGTALWVDPDHGTTLFGFAGVYTDMVRAGVNGWTWDVVVAGGVALLACLVVLGAGFQMSRVALRWPEQPIHWRRTVRYRPWGNRAMSVAVSLIARSVWRIREVRKPMLWLAVVGGGFTALADMDVSRALALAVSVPLAVSLAWATNAYAMIGPGLSWAASQPKVMRNLPVAAAGVHILVSWSILGIFALAMRVNPTVDDALWVAFVVYGAVATAMCVAVATAMAMLRPVRARLGGRGDAILPPGSSVAYLALFLLTAGAPLLGSTAIPDPTLADAVVAGTAAVAGLIFVWALSRWADPQVPARVVAEVASD